MNLPKIPKFEFKGKPLTQKQAKLFVTLLFKKDTEEPINISSLKNEFSAKILIKRIEVYKLKFNISDMFLIMSIETFIDNPAKLIILLRLCYQHWQKTNQTFLNINEWANIFPWGIPTEQELHNMWKSQKHPEYNNLLDYPFSWENTDTRNKKKD